MRNNESSENYLETILILSKKLPVVRSVDIANELGFKKSSVSIAMKNLREKNNITVSDAGFITLTESGRQAAVRQRVSRTAKQAFYVWKAPIQSKQRSRILWITKHFLKKSAKRRKAIFISAGTMPLKKPMSVIMLLSIISKRRIIYNQINKISTFS